MITPPSPKLNGLVKLPSMSVMGELFHSTSNMDVITYPYTNISWYILVKGTPEASPHMNKLN